MAGGHYEKGLLHDYHKAIQKLENCEKSNKELRSSNKDLELRCGSLEKKNEKNLIEIEKLQNQLQTVLLMTKAIGDAYEELRNRYDKLHLEHYQNSSNSSLSPSTDTPEEKDKRKHSETNESASSVSSAESSDSSDDRKDADSDTVEKTKAANEYNGRKKSGRKSGKQNGTPGHTLTRETIDKYLKEKGAEHEVICQGNMGAFFDQNPFISRYELDFKVTPVVREYRFYYPKEINEAFYNVVPACFRSSVFYGSSIKSLVVYLSDVASVPVRKIRDFLNDVLDMPVSEGTVYNFMTEFSQKAAPSLELIRSTLQNQEVLCTDATYISLDGNLAYIRVITNNNTSFYYPMKTKTIDELSEEEILKEFKGVLVHDHETALYHFGRWHQECIVHLLRYILQCEDITHHAWCSEMRDFFYMLENKRKSEGRPFSEKEGDETKRKYLEIMQKGREENKDLDSKYYKGIESTLLNRLEKYADNHLLFIKDLSIPFSNNVSEGCLRKAKIKCKVSGCWRTFKGLKRYCNSLSVIETCRKRKLPLFETIRRIIEGDVAVFT